MSLELWRHVLDSHIVPRRLVSNSEKFPSSFKLLPRLPHTMEKQKGSTARLTMLLGRTAGFKL